MMLSPYDARRCLSLLEKLDLFTAENSNIFKRGERIVVDDMSEIILKAREHWQNNPEFIEKFIASNKSLKDNQIEALKSWKNRKRSQFMIVKYCPRYAVLASIEDEKYYGVLALSDSFHTLLPMDPPVVIETSLLPYKGQIVWDGLVAISGVQFGENMENDFIEECEEKQESGEIILQL